MKKLLLILFMALLGLTGRSQNESEVPDTVNLGLFINSLYDMNLSSGEFTTTFWLWMTYDDDSLEIYDHLEFPDAKEAEMISKEVEKVEGKNWTSQNFKLLVNQNYDSNQFPFDVQTLKIRVEDNMYDTRRVYFKPDIAGSKLSPQINFDDWELLDFHLEPQVVKYETAYGDPSIVDGHSEYSAVDVIIKIKRKQPGLFWKYFSVVFIAFGFIFISLILPINNLDARVSLSIGGIFATVGNKYIVDSKLPESSGFSLSDQIHIYTFVAILVCLFISGTVYLLKNRNQEKLATLINRTVIILLPIIYILLIYRAV
ncbi:MAG: hypothetical protein MH137_12900 [Flavobacteriales bacterium]|nr:hypothetical protein [Flavobacteriales bacterium]